VTIREEWKIKGLQSFAYTLREAQFLYVAAKHSSFWTMPQFCKYSGISYGSLSARFLDRALGFRHASLIYPKRGKHPAVYKISAKLQDFLGKESATDPQDYHGIRTRLMCLDFVLNNRDKEYLHTEQEKVERFHGHADILPVRRYGGFHNSCRRFPENYPIADGDLPEFVFVYGNSVNSFVRFTNAYRPLMNAIGKCRLIVACVSAEIGRMVSIAFQHALAGVEMSQEAAASFAQREQLEAKPVAELTPEDADSLRLLRNNKFSRDYDAWRRHRQFSECELGTFILPCSYEFLS
jgi:hypothetical protein